MKKLLLAGTILMAVGSSSAYAKSCGSAGTAAEGADAPWFTLFDGSCSSDNQATDGDDLKAFLDKSGTGLTPPPVAGTIDMSLSKNTNLAIDQNTDFVDKTPLLGGNVEYFTDGDGFANIKSVSDALTTFEIDPIPNTILLTKAGPVGFVGFDGIIFKFQEVSTGTPTPTVGDLFITVNLSDMTSFTFEESGWKLNNDSNVLGFDENSLAPAGLTVDSITVTAGANLAFDQVKQIMFSGIQAPPVVPELPTWAMVLGGFALLGFVGSAKRRLASY